MAYSISALYEAITGLAMSARLDVGIPFGIHIRPWMSGWYQKGLSAIMQKGQPSSDRDTARLVNDGNVAKGMGAQLNSAKSVSF